MTSWAELKRDLDLICDNALLFNGSVRAGARVRLPPCAPCFSIR